MKRMTTLQKHMTGEEEIISNPKSMASIEEYLKAKRKGVKPWKQELDKKFDDIQQGKEIKLSPELAEVFDQRFLQSLSDIKAGRIRRVR